MVIDTSAIIAILQDEPERVSMVSAIEIDSVRLISSVTMVETSIVIEARFGAVGIRELDLLIREAKLEIAAFDEAQSLIAREAYRLFGKGRHLAGLNFGDCCTYALARSAEQPVLFKGDDFGHTDIGSVLNI